MKEKREGWIINCSFLGEANLCGSAARLRAAFHAVLSLAQTKRENDLKYTYLANDGLHDEGKLIIIATV